MAKISSLILLFLAIAASIDARAAMAAAVPNAAVTTFLQKLINSKEKIEHAADVIEAIDRAIEKPLEKLSRKNRERATAGLLKAAEAVTVVQAGGTNFSVTGVDVTSPVTRTSRCGAGADSRMVPCDDILCKQYGASCSGGGVATVFCNSSSSAALPLQKGSVALFGDRRQLILSDNTAYVCRTDASGSDDNAVLGLRRDSLLLSKLRPLLFSYVIDSNLQSTVWLSTEALLAGARTASSGMTTVKLGSLPDKPYYAVGVTGIKVGDDGDVKENNTVGVLTTTLPFTFLNPVLFDHLKQELSSSVSPPVQEGPFFDQLCYSNKTTLPAISLFFTPRDDDHAMKVSPEQYSYQSEGMTCLSILRSPLKNGASIIGSMLQAGRRMTYDLDAKTLTFGDAMSQQGSSSSQQASSPVQSRSSATPAATHVLGLALALAPLLLAMIV